MAAGERSGRVKRKCDEMMGNIHNQDLAARTSSRKDPSAGEISKKLNTGEYLNGCYNRGPSAVLFNEGETWPFVWSKKRMGSYVYNFINKSAPVTLLVRKNTEGRRPKYEIYDGFNRAVSIYLFYYNKIPMIDEGDDSKDLIYLKEFTSELKTQFYDTDLIVTVLENYTKAQACEVARNLNKGTPMSFGGMLGFCRADETCRSRLLDEICTRHAWLTGLLGAESKGNKLAANIIQHVECSLVKWNDFSLVKSLEFFSNDAVVDHAALIRKLFDQIGAAIVLHEDGIKALGVSKKRSAILDHIHVMEACAVLYVINKRNVSQLNYDAVLQEYKDMGGHRTTKKLIAEFK